jgi:electron transport complex protein RnfB
MQVDYALVGKAVLALSAIGVLVGMMLSTASRKFHVVVDERVEHILDALPGANCGACGNPSCFGAAEAMASERAPVTTCVAGGPSVAAAVAAIMGADAVPLEVVVSARHCGGGTRATRRFRYSGVDSCASVAKAAGGDLTCSTGCFGYGDCVRACPFDAMALDERGLPVIDLVACTGCGICVGTCPRSQSVLLELLPENGAVVVRCSSHDRPKDRKAYCSVCCIACKKCEKACPSDAIHVVDLLAVVDYDKCIACGQCVAVCPQECIDITGRQALAPAASIDGCAAKVTGFAPLEIVRADAPDIIPTLED